MSDAAGLAPPDPDRPARATRSFSLPVDGRLVLLAAVALIYAAIFLALDLFRGPITRDESHFWRTSLLFSHSLVPPIALLRDYPEFNTPLPFLLFGLVEHLFHQGVWLARLVNFTLSFAIVAGVALAARRGESMERSLPSVVGLLLFPYFLGVSAFVYTDTVAAVCVFFGVVLHCDRRYVASALFLALAIAARQFMVAFPLALALHAWLAEPRGRRTSASWLAPLLAAATLGGWILFFGDLGPPGEIARQRTHADDVVGIPGLDSPYLLGVMPKNSLYFLACVGAYFVLAESLLLRDASVFRRVRSRAGVAIMALLALLFAIFPPLQNHPVIDPLATSDPRLYTPVTTMGFLDRLIHRMVGDGLRMAIFWALASLALLRFARFDLALWLLLANAGLMLIANGSWDKYALPLLAVLWFLEASGRLRPAVAPVPAEAAR